MMSKALLSLSVRGSNVLSPLTREVIRLGGKLIAVEEIISDQTTISSDL